MWGAITPLDPLIHRLWSQYSIVIYFLHKSSVFYDSDIININKRKRFERNISLHYSPGALEFILFRWSVYSDWMNLFLSSAVENVCIIKRTIYTTGKLILNKLKYKCIETTSFFFILLIYFIVLLSDGFSSFSEPRLSEI